MDNKEKALFVALLLGGIQDEVMQYIDDNRIPEHWDGVELRWLLADIAEGNTVNYPVNTHQHYRERYNRYKQDRVKYMV